MSVGTSEHGSGRSRQQGNQPPVVGCDGSRSLVREPTGIPQARSDHDRLMVLLVFRSTGLHDLLKRYSGKSFYCVLKTELEGYR